MEGEAKSENWLSKAVDAACTDQSQLWNQLLGTVSESCDAAKQEKHGGKRFSQLSPAEQAAVIEGQMFEMQQQKSPLLLEFSSFINNSIDQSLLSTLQELQSRSRRTTYGQSLASLALIASDAIAEVLDNSPPEYRTSSKLFLNRPIPLPLRSIIWKSVLFPSNDLIKKRSASLAPCLHIALSRRCQSLMDNFSSKTRLTISFVKSAISSALNQLSITTALAKDSVSKDVDTLFFIVLPLIYIFANNDHTASYSSSGSSNSHGPGEGAFSNHKSSHVARSSEASSAMSSPSASSIQDSYESSQLICAALVEMVVSPELLALAPSSQFANVGTIKSRKTTYLAGHTKLNNSPFSPSVWKILEAKDALLAKKLKEYAKRTAIGAHANHDPWQDSSIDPTTASIGVSLLSSCGDLLEDGILKEDKLAQSFDEPIQLFLERGGVSFLDLECVYFVWDQGFIAGFNHMLALIVVAIILGLREELIGLKELCTAVTVFRQYCQRLRVPTLQRLLSTHCEPELLDLFDIGGNYKIQRKIERAEDDGDVGSLLQAVYCKWQQTV